MSAYEQADAIIEVMIRKITGFPGELSTEEVITQVVVDTLLIADGTLSVEDFSGECLPTPGCGCMCHRPEIFGLVAHVAPCCYPEEQR